MRFQRTKKIIAQGSTNRNRVYTEWQARGGTGMLSQSLALPWRGSMNMNLCKSNIVRVLALPSFVVDLSFILESSTT